MDHNRSPGVRMPVGRKPLADAPQRVNSGTVASVGRQSRDIGTSKPRVPIKCPSGPAANSFYDFEHYEGGHSPPIVATAQQLVHPRLSAIKQTAQKPLHQSSDSRPASPNLPSFSNAGKDVIGPWELGKELGQGTSAQVRKGKHRVTQDIVAVKIVARGRAHLTQASSLANLFRSDSRQPTMLDNGLRRMPLAIEREVAILKCIKHPNIIELKDIWENRQAM